MSEKKKYSRQARAFYVFEYIGHHHCGLILSATSADMFFMARSLLALLILLTLSACNSDMFKLASGNSTQGADATTPDSIELISYIPGSDPRAPASGDIFEGVISGNGRYLYIVAMTGDLDPAVSSGIYHTYRYDTQTMTMSTASVTQAGAESNAICEQPRSSYDGSKIVMKCQSTNLEATLATNTGRQAVVKNLSTGLVSVASSTSDNSTVANGTQIHSPFITTSGSFVSFVSYDSSNLVTGASSIQLYRKNLATGLIDLISADGAGTPAVAGKVFNHAHLSDDGTSAVFAAQTGAFGISPAFTTDYFKDLTTGALSVAAKDEGGTPVATNGGRPRLLADKKTIFFLSSATVLAAYPTNGRRQLYRRDHLTDEVSIVSTSELGSMVNNHIVNFEVTPDGKYLLMHTSATNLIDGQVLSALPRIYRKNLTTGAVKVASSDTSGNINQTWEAKLGSISDDGKRISFFTKEDLGGMNSSGNLQMFLRYLND